MKKKITILLIIGCLLVIGLIMGGSYAYFSSYDTSESQMVKVGMLEITYETGQDIQMENALPVADESGASTHQFTIRNTNDQAINYNISLVDISLQKDGKDVFSNNLIWGLYKTDSTYQQSELIKYGTFSSPSGFLSGDKELVIKTDLHLEAGESQSYCLKIGLLNSTFLQNKDAGMDLSTKIQVDTYDRVEPVSKQSLFNTEPFGSSEFQDVKSLVTRIVYQNRINPISNALFTVDASFNQDGSCMTYLVENQEETGTYTIYIQGNDEIYLPESSAGMYKEMVKLEEIVNMELLNTSRVVYMAEMFAGCLELTSLDLSNFDTSNVVTMWGMFAQCRKLTNLNIDSFDTSKVTSMAWMFENTALTGIDLSHFDTSQVADMSGMFYNNQNLKWIDVSSFNTSKVENMRQFVDGCVNLTNLDLSHFNVSKVTNVTWMFRNCTSLARINFDNTIFSDDTSTFEVFLGLNPNVYIIVENTTAQEGVTYLLNQNGITTATVVVAN
ncbi:MAG TPA: BspA family leucine-rich repeat surface protein [Candidatus Scybalousia intestinigallinarum]|nr:BspA family leucine-rich repeat surface protein [Candidatus Scybalousia intestinigallinarum]